MKDAIKNQNPVLIDLSISTNKNQNKIKKYNKWRKRIEIDIKEKASQNRANQELKNFLSEKLDIPIDDIRVKSGRKSSKKTLALYGKNKQEIIKKLKKQLK
ncbi:YggU family protein [archaeon SCG-AAA382B04]|nr:YggU family protein [archaeon SCG-AAA382B04]